jgi:hypothetical protein
MDSTQPNSDSSNPADDVCKESYQCPRTQCPSIHSTSQEEERRQIEDLRNDLCTKIKEKDRYIVDTSQEAIEIVVNWYQRLINDLIESQTQIIENIENERDRARGELAQFDVTRQSAANDVEQKGDMQAKLVDLSSKLSHYQITKDTYLPDSRTFQPRYKISYEFKSSSLVEEDWDIETNETTNIPLPSRLTLSTAPTTTAAPSFRSDTSHTFVTPKDDDEQTDANFQWREELQGNNNDDSEYLLDPRSYHRGSPRHFPLNIHLVASDGNDLL